MRIGAVLVMLLVASTINGQKLPSKFTDQPDGLTIGYFNTAADSCFPEVFVGDSLQILFPCYSRKNYERINISSSRSEINRIRKVLTPELISKLQECCSNKGCPDTGNGYMLIVKRGTDVNFFVIDIRLITSDKCGNEELIEVINLLKKIDAGYR